ncbi:MAG: Nucleotide sugar dehydrogenase [Candidatus Woesebacteria bacterium GW2011_GWB1_45_5]|uniref:Nucleotide sugar dehydrogenase n=1 Tax=Candidatus Woesebacteria bacterium GW2011_GWB1_45_5 TaxID=1618581 RepID=A0A0G1MPZ3_9BACT|nr:MAG: Nucleotide sugar dehydrogenase [Candidatus Woesebacteria bacterium GW2011_GWB1_45_5]
MNIGIIGYGYVGRATGEGFSTNPDNKIFWYDKFKESPNTLDEVVKKSDFIFISVPTPIFEDYSGMDMNIVEGVIDQVAPKIGSTHKILIIKSTSLPGTTRKMAKKYGNVNFVTNPEFLTQKNANKDFLKPFRTVIGCDSRDVGERVKKLYATILPKDQKYFITDPTSAEVIKYMSNLMLASKSLLANEFYDLSQKVGANYIDVQAAVESDPRIGTHLGVPGSDGDRGFGGACFPKDMVGILGLAGKLKLDMSALTAVWKKNLKIRKHRDWEEMPQAFNKKKK